MKLKYIDGPYGYARDVKALEIFENAVNNSEWLDENDSLVSGDMVGTVVKCRKKFLTFLTN